MKRLILMLMIVVLVIGCSSNDNTSGPSEYTPSASQLLNETFMSISLGEEREIQVYLPAGYDDAEMANMTYPLIIFLHGANSTPSSYSGLGKAILDNLISDSTIHSAIIAFPNSRGGVEPFRNPFYTNSTVNGDYEDYIINDVIDYMDANYRTTGTPAERAIMGHSMGGYGAMKLALKHQDMFAAVATHSGPFDFAQFPGLIPYLLAENGGSGPFLAVDSSFTLLSWSMACAFSPNPDATPYPADFPVDNDGNIIESIFARWEAHNPALIAVEMAPYDNMAIYFDCGTMDELGVYPTDVAFDDTLTAHGIEHTFVSYVGTHTSGLITRFPIALVFIDGAMHPAAATMMAFTH
ncbi:MAG: alpha/beta fold hydrolase [bacterium]